MAKNIVGNHDGLNGGNESYKIRGRRDVPRATVVKEVKKNQHPNYTITKINSKEYVKAKPDNKTKNNVNR